MSREDIIAVAARLFAVYFAYAVITAFSYGFLMPEAPAQLKGVVLATFVIGLSVSLLLWFFPLTVARKLLPSPREPRTADSLDARVVLSLGLAIIGIWMMAKMVYPLAFSVIGMVVIPQTMRADLAESRLRLFSELLQFGAGAWLAFGSRGLQDAIHRARYGRLVAKQPGEGDEG